MYEKQIWLTKNISEESSQPEEPFYPPKYKYLSTPTHFPGGPSQGKPGDSFLIGAKGALCLYQMKTVAAANSKLYFKL